MNDPMDRTMSIHFDIKCNWFAKEGLNKETLSESDSKNLILD